MAIAALVCGIISLVMAVMSFGILGFVGTVLAVLGIIFGVLGKKDMEHAGLAKGGFVCSIIALCMHIVIIIILFSLFGIAFWLA